MSKKNPGEGTDTTEHAFAFTLEVFGSAGTQLASSLLKNDQDPNTILLLPTERGFASFKRPFKNEDVLRDLVGSIDTEELRGGILRWSILSENKLLTRLLLDGVDIIVDPSPGNHRPKRILYQYQPSAKPKEVSDFFSKLGKDTQISHILLGPWRLGSEATCFQLGANEASAAFDDSVAKEIAQLRNAGVQLILQFEHTKAFVDAFSNDAGLFEQIYEKIVELIHRHKVDGIDFPFAKGMNCIPVSQLMLHLRKELGSNFCISLTAEARVLQGSQHDSYQLEVLERLYGRLVSWYNIQFFDDAADFLDLEQYRRILSRGWPARKIVPVVDICNVNLQAMEFFIEIESARSRSVFGGIGCLYQGDDSTAVNATPSPLQRALHWLDSAGKTLEQYYDAERSIDVAEEERQKAAHFHRQPAKSTRRMEAPGSMNLTFQRMDPEKFTDDMLIETLEIKASKEISTSAEYSIPSDSHFMAYFVIPKLGPKIRFMGSPVFDKHTKSVISDINRRKEEEPSTESTQIQQGANSLGKDYMMWRLEKKESILDHMKGKARKLLSAKKRG